MAICLRATPVCLIVYHKFGAMKRGGAWRTWRIWTIHVRITFRRVLPIPKSAVGYNQNHSAIVTRLGEKRAHHKWNTNNQLASVHNKYEERANGHHNGGTRPKELKYEGIDASWEENIVSDDSMIGPLHAGSRTRDHPLHLCLPRIQLSSNSTFFPRKEYNEFDLHPKCQPLITRRNRARWTYSTNELIQHQYSLITCNQQALLDPDTPLRDEAEEGQSIGP